MGWGGMGGDGMRSRTEPELRAVGDAQHSSSDGLQLESPEAKQNFTSHRSGAPGVTLGGVGAPISAEVGGPWGRDPQPQPTPVEPGGSG